MEKVMKLIEMDNGYIYIKISSMEEARISPLAIATMRQQWQNQASIFQNGFLVSKSNSSSFNSITSNTRLRKR